MIDNDKDRAKKAKLNNSQIQVVSKTETTLPKDRSTQVQTPESKISTEPL